MTRVLIADDDHLMRAGLVELLTADPDIAVVGQAAAKPSSRHATSTRTSCSWMCACPTFDGIAATREPCRVAPHIRILILTTFEQDDYIFGALRAGASGFLLKRTRPEDLIADKQVQAVYLKPDQPDGPKPGPHHRRARPRTLPATAPGERRSAAPHHRSTTTTSAGTLSTSSHNPSSPIQPHPREPISRKP